MGNPNPNRYSIDIAPLHGGGWSGGASAEHPGEYRNLANASGPDIQEIAATLSAAIVRDAEEIARKNAPKPPPATEDIGRRSMHLAGAAHARSNR